MNDASHVIGDEHLMYMDDLKIHQQVNYRTSEICKYCYAVLWNYTKWNESLQEK